MPRPQGARPVGEQCPGAPQARGSRPAPKCPTARLAGWKELREADRIPGLMQLVGLIGVITETRLPGTTAHAGCIERSQAEWSFAKHRPVRP